MRARRPARQALPVWVRVTSGLPTTVVVVVGGCGASKRVVMVVYGCGCVRGCVCVCLMKERKKPRAHWFSYHWLLDVKHMVILTYLFQGNLMLPQRLLIPISKKGSFYMHLPHQQDSTYHSFRWTSCGRLVGMENNPNCKCIHCSSSIG